MNSLLLLGLEVLISISVSFTVLYVLSRPLRDVLFRICPDEQAAAFWTRYTKVMLLIAPLLLVLAVDLFTHFADPLDTLRLALMATLGGMLLGLHSVGKRLGRFVTAPQQPAAVL